MLGMTHPREIFCDFVIWNLCKDGGIVRAKMLKQHRSKFRKNGEDENNISYHNRYTLLIQLKISAHDSWLKIHLFENFL